MTIEIPPLEPEDDFIGGTSSSALLGAVIEYRYSRGTEYRLSFDDSFQVRFDELSAAGLRAPTPVLSCRVRELRAGQYLVHWIVKPASIHVSLIIDLDQWRIDSSAMMPPNRWEFFDTGEITRFELGTSAS
jgi:hypothetical protein